MQGSLPSSSITSIWHLWRRSLLCLHPSRVCRHRAYCKWKATSRLQNPTSTSLTNTSIGLRIGRLWVSTSTSNLLTIKQYSSFCFWLSAWFRPSHGLTGSYPGPEVRFRETPAFTNGAMNDNVLYHSLLRLASPQQVWGSLSEMGTICSSGLATRNAPNDVPGPWGVCRY